MRWLNTVRLDVGNDVSVVLDFMQVPDGILMLGVVSEGNVGTLVLIEGNDIVKEWLKNDN